MPSLYGYLTETGTLFYNGKIPIETLLGKGPFKGVVALEAEWNGLRHQLRVPGSGTDLFETENPLFYGRISQWPYLC